MQPNPLPGRNSCDERRPYAFLCLSPLGRHPQQKNKIICSDVEQMIEYGRGTVKPVHEKENPEKHAR